MNQHIKTLFWVCLIAFPILSKSFFYPSGANESFDPKKHILLAEKQVLAPNDDIVAVPDVWRDRQTGQTYRVDDYSGKRRWQAVWDALMLAVLTMAGTCFYIASERPDDYSRRQVWVGGFLTWVVLSGSMAVVLLH